MFFCYCERELLDLTRPEARSASVELLPDEREAADAVEQARHCGVALVVRAEPFEHPFPRRDRDRVAESLISNRVRGLASFTFFVDPFADARPSVREALQALTFERCEAADYVTFCAVTYSWAVVFRV